MEVYVQEEPTPNLFQDLEELIFQGQALVLELIDYYLHLMQLDQIKVEDQKPVLVCVMDQKYLKNYYEIVDLLRENNINAEIFLSTKKSLGKTARFSEQT